ncbi:MAG: hypothetical protein HY444_01975 [Nitrospirae bacterium]|nr:hypothetical protein [Nitrospirota bacterium]
MARYTGRWDGGKMVLVFQSDPLDTEDARGRFYHVCLGRMQEAEMPVPPPDQPYECPRCGVELETEDFWIAQVKGSV